MANWSDPRIGASQPTVSVGRDVAYDAGLRSHMLSVYNYMTSGVLLTAIIAVLFANSGAVFRLIDLQRGGWTGLGYVVLLAPVVIPFIMSFGLHRIKTSTAQILFWVYAALLGMSFSALFLVYTASSIAMTFFATAAAFASLSLWGYTTKRDLSGWGTFLLMGVVGLIVATMLSMFFPTSSGLQLAISAIGVLIFAGLTVYYTQTIKSLYFQVAGTDMQTKVAIIGALQLYLAFVNMFLYLLRFMGSSRS